MENKYYIPEIEDFYVGYEYESEQDELRSIWEKQKIENALELSVFMNQNSKYLGKYVNIRTLHLTQAQIEAEGFQLLAKSVDLWFKFKESPVTHTKIQDFYRYKPYNLFLNYGLHDCRLVIKCDFLGDNDFDKADTLFEGYCPSINELRSIFKLLKIKWQ